MYPSALAARQLAPPPAPLRLRRRSRASAGSLQPSASVEPPAYARRAADSAPLRPDALREAAKRAAAGLAAVLVALEPLSLSAPPPASAALVNPNTRLPKNAEVALRRAIPVFSEPVQTVQAKMEEVGFLLRIPQRKPWGNMVTGLTEAREILSSQRQPILDAVPEPDRPAAAAAIDALSSRLETVAAAAQAQDADVTAARLAVALDQLGKLELLQAPGLPFLIPAAYSDRPRLVGRAAAEVVFQRPGGAFSPLSDGKGAQPTAKVVVTLDGYNAPLTAGNAAALIDLGFFNGVELAAPQSAASVLAVPRRSSPFGNGNPLPLELRAQGEYEPRYRVPLDALGAGEMPVLPISVYGAVAALRGENGNDSSNEGIFFYLYDRRTSGLGGLSFDEGQFSVLGYVTEGEEVLSQLRKGDRIASAKLISGKERLVLPPGSAAEAAARAAKAEAALNAPQQPAAGGGGAGAADGATSSGGR